MVAHLLIEVYQDDRHGGVFHRLLQLGHQTLEVFPNRLFEFLKLTTT